jgi:hypothetical protein
MEKKTYFTMEYGELETIIAKAYGLQMFQMCAANDTSYTYDVKKKPLNEGDLERLPKLIAGACAEDWEMDCILQDLVNKDLLEEGEYLIKVSW